MENKLYELIGRLYVNNAQSQDFIAFLQKSLNEKEKELFQVIQNESERTGESDK
jgi:hypothetical protein